MAKFFSYQKGKEILIEKKTQRQLKDNKWELLRSFNKIQDCRAWVKKQFPHMTITDNVKSVYTGWSPETREKVRAWRKKLAARSDYFKIKEETKRKISRTMKGTRRGSYNPNFGKVGKKRKPSTRYLMGLKKRGLKWCVDDQGINHRVQPDFVLPKGWCWGINTRKFDKI